MCVCGKPDHLQAFMQSFTPHVLTCGVCQVASHAQKYFIRLNSMNKKDKRRASIHDITSAGVPGAPDLSGATSSAALDQSECYHAAAQALMSHTCTNPDMRKACHNHFILSCFIGWRGQFWSAQIIFV